MGFFAKICQDLSGILRIRSQILPEFLRIDPMRYLVSIIFIRFPEEKT